MAKGSHAGAFGSWLAVVVMWIGFGAGGIALVMGPAWWLFWTGAGVVALGGILGLVVRIFDDVVLDAPRVLSEETRGSTALNQDEPELRGGPHGDTSGRLTATDPATQRPHG